jgi:hypothetical protein
MLRRVVLLFAFLIPAVAWAEPQHMLDYLLPRGGTRGTTVEVHLHGQYLNDPREILFYGAGIKASTLTSGAKPAEDVSARFEIAPDCPLGEHVLRLRTATGLTEAVTFWVSPFPTVMETEKKIGDNDTLQKAQAVAMNSTVEGQINPGDQLDRDIYSVHATKGARISVEVESVRLGTLHFTNGEHDLMARILDSTGKELASADDSSMYVQDPVLSIIAPDAGMYFVEIRQALYQTPRQAWYRVHIGNFTRPTGIYPAGGRVGEKLQVRILGDPSGPREETLTLPKESGNFNYFAGPRGQQPPSPNVLRVSPYPNVLKVGAGESTPVPALPAALNGMYTDSSRPDVFSFRAKKDDSWRVRVYARTLGSPMDPRIWIRAANNPKDLLAADDSRMPDLGYVSIRGSWSQKDVLDPVAIFKVPADGAYLIGITDSRGSSGPDYVYRIEMEPVRDTIYTHITSPDGYQIPRLTGLIVPQSSRWTISVQLAPGIGNNYKDEVELEAVGLPPGVTMIAPRFPKGATRMPVQFVAAPDAALQSALIELRARPLNRSIPLETGSQQGFYLMNRPNEYPWHLVFLNKFALAVTQHAPFDLELEDPQVPLIRNGELTLKVKVHRDADFHGPVEIQVDWLPPNVSGSPTVTIPADKSEGEYKIQANDRVVLGNNQIAISGSTTGGDGYSGFGRVRVSSKFISLRIADPYITVSLQRSSIERGKSGEIVAELKQSVPFDGKAAVNLLRLPKGIVLEGPPPQITSEDTRVVFRLSAASDALLGLYRNIGCEVVLSDKGHSIRQVSGAGVLRVDPSRTVTSPVVEAVTPVSFNAAPKPPLATGTDTRPVSFRLDVMPIFFRAGCNGGGCHGAASGKDGFHLSLFGYDPAGDYDRLTRQIVGRRIDLAAPEQSLLLLKATGSVRHSGGRRFTTDTLYYQTLLRWITAGAPDDSGQVPQVTGISLVPGKIVFSGKQMPRPLQVMARYSDDSSRPVNDLALYLTNNKEVADISDNGTVTAGKKGDTWVFARFAKFTTGAEVIVLPDDKSFHWPKISSSNYIDDVVNSKLKYLRIVPSELSTDEEFLRRAYLDLIGRPPTPEEFTSFIKNKNRRKRPDLIEALLARDEFADLWATKWAEMLKIVSNGNSAFGTDRKAAYAYYEWIRDEMHRNTPLDQFARAQILATGSNLRNPAVNLYTMIPQGQFDPKSVALDIAEVFTGVRIQCAQCHNHPFDSWTQDDFYGFVSFFTGVKRKPASESRELFIYDDPQAPPANHLLDGHPVPAKFLGGASPDVKGKDPRLALADWLTSKDNPFFARNMANRIWAHFFGKGIIDPVDDVRISNPPSNRELLDELARRLVVYQFDAKRLIRDICNSRTYQLSSLTNSSNRDDDRQFSHAHLRRLRADVLLDSISSVTQTPSTFGNYPNGLKAIELFEGGARANNYFVKTFGMTNRDSVHTAETRLEPTLAQALHLINGDTIEGKIARSAVVTDLLKAKVPPASIIENLYIRALSRQPSKAELKKLLPLVIDKPGNRQAYDDIFWALLNSSEFEFNH